MVFCVTSVRSFSRWSFFPAGRQSKKLYCRGTDCSTLITVPPALSSASSCAALSSSRTLSGSLSNCHSSFFLCSDTPAAAVSDKPALCSSIGLGSGGGTVQALYRLFKRETNNGKSESTSCSMWESRSTTNEEEEKEVQSFLRWLDSAPSPIVVIHAGGYSRRLPGYSALGKVWVPTCTDSAQVSYAAHAHCVVGSVCTDRMDTSVEHISYSSPRLLHAQHALSQALLDGLTIRHRYKVLVMCGDALTTIASPAVDKQWSLNEWVEAASSNEVNQGMAEDVKAHLNRSLSSFLPDVLCLGLDVSEMPSSSSDPPSSTSFHPCLLKHGVFVVPPVSSSVQMGRKECLASSFFPPTAILQKPSVDTLQTWRHKQAPFCSGNQLNDTSTRAAAYSLSGADGKSNALLLDVGIWLLSLKGVEVLTRKSIQGATKTEGADNSSIFFPPSSFIFREATQHSADFTTQQRQCEQIHWKTCDLYTSLFPLESFISPVSPPPSSLTLGVCPLPRGTVFKHYGTTSDLFDASFLSSSDNSSCPFRLVCHESLLLRPLSRDDTPSPAHEGHSTDTTTEAKSSYVENTKGTAPMEPSYFSYVSPSMNQPTKMEHWNRWTFFDILENSPDFHEDSTRSLSSEEKEQRCILIDRCALSASVFYALSHHHVLTGIPYNEWQVKLPPYLCIDVTPIALYRSQKGIEKGSDSRDAIEGRGGCSFAGLPLPRLSYLALRPYHFFDTFSGALGDPQTTFLQPGLNSSTRSLVSWLSERDLSPSDLFSCPTGSDGIKNGIPTLYGKIDIFDVPLFPCFSVHSVSSDGNIQEKTKEALEYMEEILEWMMLSPEAFCRNEERSPGKKVVEHGSEECIGRTLRWRSLREAYRNKLPRLSAHQLQRYCNTEAVVQFADCLHALRCGSKALFPDNSLKVAPVRSQCPAPSILSRDLNEVARLFVTAQLPLLFFQRISQGSNQEEKRTMTNSKDEISLLPSSVDFPFFSNVSPSGHNLQLVEGMRTTMLLSRLLSLMSEQLKNIGNGASNGSDDADTVAASFPPLFLSLSEKSGRSVDQTLKTRMVQYARGLLQDLHTAEERVKNNHVERMDEGLVPLSSEGISITSLVEELANLSHSYKQVALELLRLYLVPLLRSVEEKVGRTHEPKREKGALKDENEDPILLRESFFPSPLLPWEWQFFLCQSQRVRKTPSLVSLPPLSRSSLLSDRKNNGSSKLCSQNKISLPCVSVECPVRVDLCGGWTDTPPYGLWYGGEVINVAVEWKKNKADNTAGETEGVAPISIRVYLFEDSNGAPPAIRIRSIEGTVTTTKHLHTYNDLYAALQKDDTVGVDDTSNKVSGGTRSGTCAMRVEVLPSMTIIPCMSLILLGFLPEFSTWSGRGSTSSVEIENTHSRGVDASFGHDYCSLSAQLLDYFKGAYHLGIDMAVDVPCGSGLGTSSLVAAAVMKGLLRLCDQYEVSKYSVVVQQEKDRMSTRSGKNDGGEEDRPMIARLTLLLEQLMRAGGGWQDAYGGVLPELKHLSCSPVFSPPPVDSSTSVDNKAHHLTSPVLVPSNYLSDIHVNTIPTSSCLLFSHPLLAPCHLLFYTGIQREAKHILSDIVGSMILSETSALTVLGEMRELVGRVAQLLSIQSIEEIQDLETEETNRENMSVANVPGEERLLYKLLSNYGGCIHESWKLNQRLDPMVTRGEVDLLLEIVSPFIFGAKLCGAGGGGFMYLVARSACDAEKIVQLCESHRNPVGVRTPVHPTTLLAREGSAEDTRAMCLPSSGYFQSFSISKKGMTTRLVYGQREE